MVIENEECRKGWHIHNVDYYIKHSLATILHVSSFTSSYTKFAFSFSECSNGICWGKLHVAFETDAYTFLCRRSNFAYE